MELDETEQSFVIKFLENFNEISKHITSLTKSFYLGVYKNQHKFFLIPVFDLGLRKSKSAHLI